MMKVNFRMQTTVPIYYAGFEVGSGFSGLKIIPADNLSLAQDLATLPSFLGSSALFVLTLRPLFVELSEEEYLGQ